jgi:hypothetical protein
MSLSREAALDVVAGVVDAVETEPMPVPVREVWVYGDVALGLDPVERLDVYVTKDLLMRGDAEREATFRERTGIRGVGQSVSADWAEQFPEYLRANDAGYAAPERCLAAHLLPDGDGNGDGDGDADPGDDVPVHLEVCNAGFEDNVTQRLRAALDREAYDQVLDPRGVCLWAEGTRSSEAMTKLRDGALVFPTLPEALEMLGADADVAETAAETIRDYRADQVGTSVRGDVV